MIRSLQVADHCIGCGTCEKICPSNFRVQGKAKVISTDFSHEKEILEAERNCPVMAIAAESTEIKEEKKYPLSLAQKTFLTADVVELVFEAPELSFVPGQFVTIFFSDHQGAFSRSYSIVRLREKMLVLCVKFQKDGRGAEYFRNMQKGDRLECSDAKGTFQLQHTQSEKVFVATGTGIAPLVAMMESCPEEIQKTVIFGVRSEEDIFYSDLLVRFPNTKVLLPLSNPPENWKGKKGRVTEYLSEIAPTSEVYICGNSAMISSVLQVLHNVGHPKNLIFHESFVATGEAIPKQGQKLPLILTILPWMQKTLLLVALCVPLVWFFPAKWNLLWDISWWSVVILMLLRPLSEVFPKLVFLKHLIPLRKGLGILSASVVTVTAIYTYVPHLDLFFSTYFSLYYWSISNYNFFAHLGELTGIVLLLTSNVWSQKVLGRSWKKIQRLSYVYFITGGIYEYHLGKPFVLSSMIIVGIIWGIAQCAKWKPLFQKI
ncbi:ferredoxin [Candidatus Peregrinibacteria bacterium]|nr:MAG: ferredoxin [Candidatus Peregrinibacteria bacterium]